MSHAHPCSTPYKGTCFPSLKEHVEGQAGGSYSVETYRGGGPRQKGPPTVPPGPSRPQPSRPSPGAPKHPRVSLTKKMQDSRAGRQELSPQKCWLGGVLSNQRSGGFAGPPLAARALRGDGLASFWRLVVLGSLAWMLPVDLSSSLLFLRLFSSISPAGPRGAARRALGPARRRRPGQGTPRPPRAQLHSTSSAQLGQGRAPADPSGMVCGVRADPGEGLPCICSGAAEAPRAPPQAVRPCSPATAHPKVVLRPISLFLSVCVCLSLSLFTFFQK